MWSSIMALQGHSFMPVNSPVKQQQQRDFGMLFSALPIATGKSFKNPNFVNNFIYQNTLNPVDSSTRKYQNSCHSHIIDSIKEQCPEVIPSAEESILTETTPTLPAMCSDNSNPENKTKSLKRDHTQRKKRQSGKHSKQNQKRQEIKDMLQAEDMHDTLNSSTDISSSPRIHILHLKDFLTPKMCPTPCNTMVQSIEIPISNTEMVLTITKAASSPNRCRQYSFTDSEDSFIIFDHQGNEEHPKDEEEIKESLCNRLRKPSVCESEDSFILFDHDNDDYESDYCLDDSTDQEDDEERDWQNESQDETDSSFSIVQPKKVRFPSEHELCEVHPMIKWSYAYQAARKGPWEMYARDRCRFRERAGRVEKEIKYVFSPQLRERIYKERFENL